MTVCNVLYNDLANIVYQPPGWSRKDVETSRQKGGEISIQNRTATGILRRLGMSLE